MEENLISFESAKLAKEKGFESELSTYYNADKKLIINKVDIRNIYSASPNHLGAPTINDFEGYLSSIDNSLDDFILAPTQSLLQKWLREKHRINISVYPHLHEEKITEYAYMIYINYADTYSEGFDFHTYEESLEYGLQEALKLIK